MALDALSMTIIACVKAKPAVLAAADIYKLCVDVCETREEMALTLSGLVRLNYLVAVNSTSHNGLRVYDLDKSATPFVEGEAAGFHHAELRISDLLNKLCLRNPAWPNPEPNVVIADIVEGGYKASILRRQALPEMLPQQVEAVDGAIRDLASNDRIKVIMACGTGKTRVGSEIAIRISAKAIVIYLPSLALVKQTLLSWLDAPFNGAMKYLCVCSDHTIRPGADDYAVTTKDLRSEFGSKSVTTDPDHVRQFLAKSQQHNNGVWVLFSTYQSSDIIADACPDGFTFDLGIFDEAHRTAGREGAFNIPLSDRNTAISKRVFMTATPKHTSLRKRANDDDLGVVFSMENEQFYGVTAYKLSMREAIRRKMITDYRVIIATVDDEMISKEFGQSGLNQSDEELKRIVDAIAIRKAMEKYGARKVITFHDSIASAQGFAENRFARQELGVKIHHVNGGLTTKVRSSILKRFSEAQSSVVTNAKCLTEGVDVPDMDMVAFLSARKSKIDVIQAIGRVLRLHGEKCMGYILLPLYIKKFNKKTIEADLLKSQYGDIWSILHAIRESDEAVNASIRAATLWDESTQPPPQHDFLEFIGPEIYIENLRSTISTHCTHVLGLPWDKAYRSLLSFVRENGHSDVPNGFVTPSGIQLGFWCARRRDEYRCGTLSPERIKDLDDVGFIWRVFDTRYERNLSRLKVFFKEHGHVNVPAPYITRDKSKLGSWCVVQRTNYRKGSLSKERIADLEALGFKWDLRDDPFNLGLNALRLFKVLHGHISVPWGYITDDGINLPMWCASRRYEYKKGEISKERIALLEALGFAWDLLDAQFEHHMFLLEKYKVEHGNVNVPYKYMASDGTRLGFWCGTRRHEYNKNLLSVERITRLEALGFQWGLRDSKFAQGLAKLQDYKHLYGHVDVPMDYLTPDGMLLGAWCKRRKIDIQVGRLSKERLEYLQTLGFAMPTGLPMDK